MWISPIPLNLFPDSDPNGFYKYRDNETAIPLKKHPGSYGFQRKNHTHEGVDLYCPEGTEVFSVEDGVIVNIEDFTGEKANSPWWNDTKAVYVEGKTGVILYGEITVKQSLKIGDSISAGTLLGTVKTVLKKDKGRPTSMLHLELHKHGTLTGPEWVYEKPETSLDPTPYLLDIAKRQKSKMFVDLFGFDPIR